MATSDIYAEFPVDRFGFCTIEVDGINVEVWLCRSSESASVRTHHYEEWVHIVWPWTTRLQRVRKAVQNVVRKEKAIGTSKH